MQGFDFLVLCTGNNDNTGNLKVYNPFLSDEECTDIITAVLVIMMCANRISQTNLAMHQITSVRKSLQALKVSFTSGTDDATKRAIICKELLSSSTNLAATLAAKRHFVSKCDGRDDVFDIDPRFMIFEFCHNILLRKSQVDLVRKLISEMSHGRSVCHQVRKSDILIVPFIADFVSVVWFRI